MAVAPDGRRRPRGLVHFLGGAFVGATPHLVYPLLIEELAAAGYTTVATPYAGEREPQAKPASSWQLGPSAMWLLGTLGA